MSIKYPQTEQFLICWFSDDFELSDDQILFEYCEVTDIKELKNLNEELICIEKGSGVEVEWIADAANRYFKNNHDRKGWIVSLQRKISIEINKRRS